MNMENKFRPEVPRPSAEQRQAEKARRLELQNLQEELDEQRAELKRSEIMGDKKVAEQTRARIALIEQAMGGERPAITEKEIRVSAREDREARARERETYGFDRAREMERVAREKLQVGQAERRRTMISAAIAEIEKDEAKEIPRRKATPEEISDANIMFDSTGERTDIRGEFAAKSRTEREQALARVRAKVDEAFGPAKEKKEEAA